MSKSKAKKLMILSIVLFVLYTFSNIYFLSTGFISYGSLIEVFPLIVFGLVNLTIVITSIFRFLKAKEMGV